MASTEDDVDEEVDNMKEDIDRLIRRHRNEKYAPELLPFDQDMVEGMSEILHFVEKSLMEDRASGEQGPTHPSFLLRSTETDRLTVSSQAEQDSEYQLLSPYLVGSGAPRLGAIVDQGLHGRHLLLSIAQWRAGRVEEKLHQVDRQLGQRDPRQHQPALAGP
eukprot:g26278.t1